MDVFDVATGEVRPSLKTGLPLHQLQKIVFTTDGKYLIASASTEFVVWEIASGEKVAAISGYSNGGGSVAASPATKTLAFGQFSVVLWDIPTRQERVLVRNSGQSITAFNPKGTLLATGSFDGQINLWDFNSGSNVASVRASSTIIDDMAFSPDGRYFATVGWDRKLKIWSTSLPKEVSAVTFDVIPTSVAFSPDGTIIVVADQMGDVRIWDAAALLKPMAESTSPKSPESQAAP